MADAKYTNIVGFAPEVAPYAQKLLGKAEALTGSPYQTYKGDRIAQFNPLQKQSFVGAAQLGPSTASLKSATGLEKYAQQAAKTKYKPSKFTNQFNKKQDFGYKAQNAQVNKMGPAEQVTTQSFAQPGSADAYMSPYMQSVVDIQKREAQRQSDIQGTQQQSQATQAGAFGGSRDAIMRAERERNLGQQMGDIQAQGSQAAYAQAQQQFNAEQQARLAAQQANQQAGLTVGGQNLSAAQQTALANQGAQNQGGQFNAGQKLQAEGLGAQYGQAANQLNEQSRQYGAGLGLQGLQAAMQGMSNLSTAGQNIYGQKANSLGIQNAFGGQQQQQVQNVLNQKSQDFANQQNDPYKKLSFMSDIINRAPTSNLGQTMYQAPPSTLNQVAGLGTAAAGLFGAYNQANKNAKGGAIKSKKPAGLQALLLNSMA
jgi:hypothetical protein